MAKGYPVVTLGNASSKQTKNEVRHNILHEDGAAFFLLESIGCLASKVENAIASAW